MLSKRDFLKWGVVAGGAALFGGGIRLASSQTGGDCPVEPPAHSPASTPFIDPLPLPPVLQPVASLDPPPDPNFHQKYGQYPPVKLYEIHVKEAPHKFHSAWPDTKVWGYNGLVPGPTIKAKYGEPWLVRYYNDLPPNHVGFGIPEISTHLHNFHTAWESDGNPISFYPSGTYRDHHYAANYAGFTSTGPIGDEREALGTLWYHDHRMDFTTGNVYRGLAAFCLIFDHKDTDNESTGLRLPSGDYDVPLVFTDKMFNPDFSLFMDPFEFGGVLGDKFCVNGVIQPHFKVARRKYRFRLLDGGPSRFYQFHLSDNSSFHLIATDGNLLEAPLEVTSTHLGVANRRDIVIDFSQYPIGTQVYLENRLEQVDGEGPTGRVLQQGTRILRFDVDRNATDSPPLPLTLRQFPPINITASTPRRTFEFERTNGAWAINGQFFNPNVPMATVQHGVPEIWTLKNGGGGWSHPVHIHFEEFRVLRLNGQTPPPELGLGRHDVIALGPNDEAQVYIQFRDFQGQYVMHCHNTAHEDHAMMTRFDIAP